MIWFYVFAFVLGVAAGSLLQIIRSPNAGTLTINQKDMEKDTYRIEVAESLDKLPKRKRIYLKIKVEK